MTVSGAYGRDYKTEKDMKADWIAGKDFVIQSVVDGPGRYVSVREFKGEVWGRFDKMTKIGRLQ